MDNTIEELLDIYNHLQSFVNKATNNKAIKSLDKLDEIVSSISKSWSGSWLGYQSRVYYKDFKPTPAGAHFSIEWGFYKDIMNNTLGDWSEYQFDYVKEYIIEKAGSPDLKNSRIIAKEGRALFEVNIENLLSLFAIYLQQRDDPFIKALVEKVKKLILPLGSDLVKKLQPHGEFFSRDSLAVTQGFMTPPHISVLADKSEICIPIIGCEELAKFAKTALTHFERQEIKGHRFERSSTKIFIGHGKSNLWKDLKNFIQDRLQLPWDEFNRVPVAGITNIARLSEMLDNAIFAFLVMTAEDEQPDGSTRARMNVVHEAGLFQGRLGFKKAIILLEDGCEEFSNAHGLGQIRFPEGNIKAVFEEIREVLEREDVID